MRSPGSRLRFLLVGLVLYSVTKLETARLRLGGRPVRWVELAVGFYGICSAAPAAAQRVVHRGKDHRACPLDVAAVS
jgi:hypothetical protein